MTIVKFCHFSLMCYKNLDWKILWNKEIHIKISGHVMPNAAEPNALKMRPINAARRMAKPLATNSNPLSKLARQLIFSSNMLTVLQALSTSTYLFRRRIFIVFASVEKYRCSRRMGCFPKKIEQYWDAFRSIMFHRDTSKIFLVMFADFSVACNKIRL